MNKLKGLVLVLMLLLPLQGWAAVAFDAASEGLSSTSTTSLTISHTTSGSNRALYCAISHIPGDIDITTVTATYNGVSMDTLFSDAATHGSRQTKVFRLVAPATGANNFVASWSGSSQLAAVCASFTGVDQADPDDAHVLTDGTGGGTSSSRSVSSATGDMVMDVITAGNGITGLSVTGTNTLVNDIQVGVSDSGQPAALAASYEAGAATVTPSWSWTGFVVYVQWAWNINADAGGGGSPATNYFRLRVNP